MRSFDAFDEGRLAARRPLPPACCLASDFLSCPAKGPVLSLRRLVAGCQGFARLGQGSTGSRRAPPWGGIWRDRTRPTGPSSQRTGKSNSNHEAAAATSFQPSGQTRASRASEVVHAGRTGSKAEQPGSGPGSEQARKRLRGAAPQRRRPLYPHLAITADSSHVASSLETVLLVSVAAQSFVCGTTRSLIHPPLRPAPGLPPFLLNTGTTATPPSAAELPGLPSRRPRGYRLNEGERHPFDTRSGRTERLARQ